MSKQTLVDKPNLKMVHDSEKNIVHLNWIGFQKEEAIYEAGNAILKEFKKLSTGFIINNNKQVSGPWNKAAKWTQEEWFPAMIASGLQKFAWVFPENLFAELSANQAMPDTQMIKKFQDVSSAEEWLLN